MTVTTPTYAGSSAILTDLLRRGSAKEIERHLDSLSPGERVDQVLAVRGGNIKRLYDALKGAPAMTLDELVPRGERGTVIFEGRNSLPAFSRFQKRFCRVGSPGSSEDVIVGYNHQAMAFATGPGYFVVRPPEESGEYAGEILLDYTEAPPAEPDAWPAFRPNDAGLSRAVFMHLQDFCRRGGRGVLVGKATKKGVDQNAYFSLVSATA